MARRSRIACGSIWALAVLGACGTDPSTDPVLDAAAIDPQDASTAPDAARGDAGAAPEDDAGAATLRAIRAVLLAPPRLAPADTASAAATGVLSNGDEIDLTLAATWSTSSATVVRVLAGGRVIAAAPGRAEIWATRGAIESNRVALEVVAPSPPDTGELRGVWVTRWTFSRTADIERIVDDVASANLNAIFMQVRGTADAYYGSTLEPWARGLSGTLGMDPGWDPLQEMITRAHARGIQVHAWINTFTAWTGTTPPTESTPRHAILSHPEWLCTDANGAAMPPSSSEYQFFSPGNGDARAHIAAVAAEIAARYAIDGVHLDYVRYPGPSYSHDPASEADYAIARGGVPNLTWADFQRSRVTALVADVKRRLAAERPAAILTVAAWPIYRNRWSWSAVSKGFDDYYQDSHAWAERGLVDALCPMTYWPMTSPKGERTDWATLIDDHLAATRAGGRHLFAAVSADHDADEVLRQIDYARRSGARGLMFFELGGLRTHGHLARLAEGPFRDPAPVPTYPWH